MEDFSRVHDMAIAYFGPPTNFSNETISSALFLALFVLANVLFIASNMIPWRPVFLIGGWIAICAGHPRFQKVLEENNADVVLKDGETQAASVFGSFATEDIILTSAPERREVEVFELQRRTPYDADSEYEPFIFSPSHYTYLSPSRISGDRPRGTRFFEDVQPPEGWRWADKKWTLDLYSREWVDERAISGVEIEIEGERWVSDILYKDESIPGEVASPRIMKSKGKEKRIVTWEEGRGLDQKGEWRRRRWVRLVERKAMGPVE